MGFITLKNLRSVDNGDFLGNGVTKHAGMYACVVTLFVQKWYSPAMLTIILYLTLLRSFVI